MKVIEFFCGKQLMTETFLNNGFDAISLDNHQVRGSRKLDLHIDFLEFNYLAYNKDFFDVLYFGFPCTPFSKASGGKHFYKGFCPKTSTALTSLELMKKMFEIINYFDKAIFYIENPSGGLCNNFYFKDYFSKCAAYIYRIHLGNYGFVTSKQTDIFTNSKVPILSNPLHRINGRHHKQKFDNLTLRQRQSYPLEFCNLIVENAKANF